MQLQGHRVAIIEKNSLQGRNQEWNISREELNGLVEMGLVSDAELQAAIVTEFNPVRVAIHGGREVFTTNCLNLGVRPKYAVLHVCSLHDAAVSRNPILLSGVASSICVLKNMLYNSFLYLLLSCEEMPSIFH